MPSFRIFLSGFTTKNLYVPLPPPPHMCYMPRPTYTSHMQDTTQTFRIVTMFVTVSLQTFRTHGYDRLQYHISHSQFQLSTAITIEPTASAAPPYYYLSLYKNIILYQQHVDIFQICYTGARTSCAGFAQAHPNGVA